MIKESCDITEEREYEADRQHVLTIEHHKEMAHLVFISINSKTRCEDFFCSADDFREMVRRVLGEE